MKSSKIFFIQRRWFDKCILGIRNNDWLEKINQAINTKNFPCLKKLTIKDNSKDKIRITIEIIEEDVLECRYGPVYKGKYFKRKKHVAR